MEDVLRFEIDYNVARIVLDRTERRNALTREIVEQMTKLVRLAGKNEMVRVLVISANGSVFCAGMDLGEMQQRAMGDDPAGEWLRDASAYRDLVLSILDAAIPTLAVVQGPALAGGMGIVLACDLVIAAEEAFFSLPEPQRGITAAVVTPLLTYRVGAAHASHLLLSGRRVSAQATVSWGLCHQVVPRDELDAVEASWLESILTGGPLALAATKQNIRNTAGYLLTKHLSEAAADSATARESTEAREGLQAFLEKRKPGWQA